MQEATINVKEIANFKYGTNKEKTGYTVIALDDTRYAIFSSTELKRLTDQVVIQETGDCDPLVGVLVRYEVKQVGDYQNRSIKQVANKSGQFESSENPKSSGGRAAKADPDKLRQDRELEIARNKSIQRQVAAKEATTIMLASPYDGDLPNWEIWDASYQHVLDKLLEVK